MNNIPILDNNYQPKPVEVEAIADLLINQIFRYDNAIRVDLIADSESCDNPGLTARTHLQSLLGVSLWLDNFSGKARFRKSPASTLLEDLKLLTTIRFGDGVIQPTEPDKAMRVLVKSQQKTVSEPTTRSLNSPEKRSRLVLAVAALEVLGFDTKEMLAKNERLRLGIEQASGGVLGRPGPWNWLRPRLVVTP